MYPYLPSSHTTDVTPNKVCLIFTAIEGMIIDIGQEISLEILRMEIGSIRHYYFHVYLLSRASLQGCESRQQRDGKCRHQLKIELFRHLFSSINPHSILCKLRQEVSEQQKKKVQNREKHRDCCLYLLKGLLPILFSILSLILRHKRAPYISQPMF
ncbi:hypothetical protein ACH5RR_003249 [Cinchona calisaya]|uniref:Uncharacterized protein n=1 Tax=Cinchona calisaya TaxID=153742 RepID=A0ABD3AUA6_9GENT